jgi:alpha-beta hydrolase superfamily lysophospholipase
MTVLHQKAASASWTEPAGLAPRGTLIVVPGRGERPEVYERFGRRIADDAYRVHGVADPTEDAALTTAQIKGELGGPRPVVLVGSDTGALFAAGLVAAERLPEVDALILAGLPVAAASAAGIGPEGTVSWEEELGVRTTCPTHRSRLDGGIVRRGALYEPIPAGWADLADLARITQPVLGVHGADDAVSPLSAARDTYAAAPHAELFSVAGTTHDALNNATHRTVAATVVLFLERLRLGPDLPPIAVRESR